MLRVRQGLEREGEERRWRNLVVELFLLLALHKHLLLLHLLQGARRVSARSRQRERKRERKHQCGLQLAQLRLALRADRLLLAQIALHPRLGLLQLDPGPTQ
jgi:hypothetical protein